MKDCSGHADGTCGDGNGGDSEGSCGGVWKRVKWVKYIFLESEQNSTSYLTPPCIPIIYVRQFEAD